MSITIPDGLPTLSRGAHRPDSGFACAMEYVSVLAGARFSDEPRCTDPVLSSWTRKINDDLIDADRHLLLPVICRLVGAYADEQVSAHLVIWVRRHPAPYNRGAEASVEWLNDLIDEFDLLSERDTEPTITMADIQAVGETIRSRQLVS